MTPGTILFDNQFRFKDGKTGEKLFVLLCNGSNGNYLSVKTTSNGARFGIVMGCQILDRFPNFYLPVHSSCLSKDTWIQLEEFYEFDSEKLLQAVLSGTINRIGLLEDKLTKDLLVCATHSDDLTEYQLELVQESLAALS